MTSIVYIFLYFVIAFEIWLKNFFRLLPRNSFSVYKNHLEFLSCLDCFFSQKMLLASVYVSVALSVKMALSFFRARLDFLEKRL